MKRLLLPLGTLAFAAFVQTATADHTDLSGETLFLHSRVGTSFTSYFSTADAFGNNPNMSSVGVNQDGAFWTSSHFSIVGVRSGTFSLDSAALGVTLDGPFEVALTYGPNGGGGTANRAARVEVSHANGVDEFIVDMSANQHEWVVLDTFSFSGAAGEYVRLFNNGNPESGSGSIQYDSLRLTLVPEPSTYALLGLGAVAFGFFGRRKK